MKLGLRSRLLTSFGIAVVLFALFGIWLRLRVRTWLIEQETSNMIALARSESLVLEHTHGDMARRAAAIATASDATVEVVRHDGRLLARVGKLPTDTRRSRKPMLSRPEVARALDTGVGSRLIDGSAEGALVVGARFHTEETRGVVLVTRSLRPINLYVRSFTMWILAGASILASFMVIASGVLSSHLKTEGVHLFSDFLDVFESTSGRSIRDSSQHEFRSLAQAVNAMARRFSTIVQDTTRERDRFVRVLDSMKDAVVAIDDEQKVTLCNQAAQDLFGWDSVPIGFKLDQHVPPELWEQLRVLLIDPEAQEKNKELLLSRLADTRMLIRTVKMHSEEGGRVIVLRDVTALRRLENVRRDFVANVSHELRTPVSTILAAAENLQAGALDDPKHAVRFVSAIVRNAERLSRIIADLLDLSRVESGELSIELQPVSVVVAAHRAVEGVESIALEKHIDLTVDLEPELSVIADEKALDQVLLNLLSNAVKYTDDNGSVRVTAERRPGEQVRIEIRDNGPGIAEKHRTRIFERFYRVDPGRSRDLGGTGLGLAIVRHLVSAMHGRVGVTPNEPRGSIFWIELSAPDETSGSVR